MSEEIKIESKNKINKKLLIGTAVFIAVALVALLIVFAPKAADAKKIQEQLSLGQKYLSELNYEQAEATYLAVLAIDPKNVDAYLGLADVYVAQGEYDKAISVLEGGLNYVNEDAAAIIKEKLEEVRAEKARAEVTPTPEPTATSTPTPVPTATNTPVPTNTPIPEPTQASTPISEATDITYVDEEFWFETETVENKLIVDAENLKVIVEDERVVAITIGGIEVQDSYVTNLAASDREMSEYSWGVTMYSDVGVYSVQTDSWASNPGENAEIAIKDMQHAVWHIEDSTGHNIGDAEMTYTEDSITWTFGIMEESSFDFLDVMSYVVNIHRIDHQKHVSRVYNSKSVPLETEAPEMTETDMPPSVLMVTGIPTPTPTPEPTATPTPEPTATPVPSPTPKPTNTPTPIPIIEMEKTMYVKSSVNVRSGPASSYKKLGSLEEGDKVQITGQCQGSNWYRIDYNGQAGFVSGNYLQDKQIVTASILAEILNNVTLTPWYSEYEPLNTEVDRVLAEVTTPGMSTYEKVKACYDYLINTSSRGENKAVDEADIFDLWYYYTEIKAHGLLTGHLGGCSDYSPAFAALMRAIGLDCYIVDGETSATAGGYTYHVWCEMLIDGTIYVFDPQVEDNIAKGGKIYYYRFGKTYEQVPEKYLKEIREYDAEGRVIKEGWMKYLSNGTAEKYTTYEYDAMGNLVKQSLYDYNGNLQNCYEYYGTGDLKNLYNYIYDDKGNLDRYSFQEYNTMGKCIKSSIYSDGYLREYRIYEYDAEGNRIKETAYTGSGRIFEVIEY